MDTRASTYDDRSGASHEGLNQLKKDTGGKHVDVVMGNPSKGFNEYGLMFNDKSWTSRPNGDGARVSAYGWEYKATAGEQLTYIGKLDGPSSLNRVKTKG